MDGVNKNTTVITTGKRIISRMGETVKGKGVYYLFISPYFFIYGLFVIFAVGYAIYLSFTYADAFNPPTWMGLDNYRRLFLMTPFSE